MFLRAGVDGGRAKYTTIDARITPSRVMMMVREGWQRENQELALSARLVDTNPSITIHPY